jgi:ribosome-binding protein aMBF1 (putative translation factor)
MKRQETEFDAEVLVGIVEGLASHVCRGRKLTHKTQKRTSDALALVAGLASGSPEMAELIERELANLGISREIYELRTKAGLSQAQLARKVGTTQSVISRLEDADYDGHSLDMLRRIAAALENHVEIRFLPNRKLQHA